MADYQPMNLLDMMAASKEAGLYGGLLGLGSALLQAGGPSTTPGSGLAALGQGGQAFLAGQQHGRQSVMGNTAAMMQMQALQRQQAAQQAWQDMFKPATTDQAVAAAGSGAPTVANAQTADAATANPMLRGIPTQYQKALATMDPASGMAFVKNLREMSQPVIKEGLILDPYTGQIKGSVPKVGEGMMMGPDGSVRALLGYNAARMGNVMTDKGMVQGADGTYNYAPGFIQAEANKSGAAAGAEAAARLPFDIRKIYAGEQAGAQYAGQKAANAETGRQRAEQNIVNIPGVGPVPYMQGRHILEGVGKAIGAAQPVQIGGQSVPAGQVENVGKEQVKRQQGASNVLSILDQIEPMMTDPTTGAKRPDLEKSLLEKATGSGIGGGVDWLARQFGASTPGADAIARLKPYEGALMMAMPRMEGPQSDKDVAMYKAAAGAIGDPTVPASQKREALQAIRNIYSRYAPQAGEWSIRPVGGQ